jgi:hypothetical protein
MSKERNFVYPRDVDAFGFDWGRLSLTVAPEVNGATKFSGGVVDLPPGQGHSRHNHPGAEEIIFVISGNGEQMVEVRTRQPLSFDPEYRRRTNAALRCLLAGRTGTRSTRFAGFPDHPCGKVVVDWPVGRQSRSPTLGHNSV